MRYPLVVTIVGLAVGTVLTACGGNDADTSTPDAGDASSDASSDTSPPPADAGYVDATLDASDAADDATPGVDSGPASCVAPPDAGPLGLGDDGGDAAALGRLLLPGQQLCVYGFTADNDVIYSDLSGNLGLIPWTGGCAEPISTSFNAEGYVSNVLLFSNQALFFFDNQGLEAWTKGGGEVLLAPGGPTANRPVVAASPDSKWLAFVKSTSSSAEVVVVKSDGTVTTPLVTGGPCPVVLQFSNSGDLYALYCPTADAETTATLSRFAAGTWARTDIATGLVDQPAAGGYNLYPLFDPTGSWAWLEAAASPQNNSLFSASNGTTTPMVDVGGGSALFDPTGSELFYVTDAGLRRSATTNPSPTTLTSSVEAQTPLVLSPDGQHLLVMNASNDLRTVSTSAPSTPLTISVDAGYTTFANDSFTADSQYVLFYGAYQSYFEPEGTLYAVPMDGGAGVSFAGKEGSFAIRGSLVAVADVSGPMATAGDVNLVDVSGVQPTRRLAPGAWVASGDPCGWLATPDRKYIVYSRSQEGLYVVPTQ